jgi:hypothetical protein
MVGMCVVTTASTGESFPQGTRDFTQETSSGKPTTTYLRTEGRRNEMEIKVNTQNGKPKVRYAVHYQDRNYEYALHSSKKHFVRNIADIVNILEYCIVQDLKQNLYKSDEKMYTFSVERLVNDKLDESFDQVAFKGLLNGIVKQMIDDNIQRNS